MVPSLRLVVLAVGVLGLGLACAGGETNTPPRLDAIGDQVGNVGEELTLELSASDPDGDSLSFGFVPDASDIRKRAGIANTSSNTATFTWVPASTDVGVHAFDFTVSDGTATARRSIAIEVKQLGGAGAPKFVKPAAGGTTLDVASESCITIPIEVIDPDSTEVTLSVEPPEIGGGAFIQEGPFTARWEWCPNPVQIGENDLYTLVLGAFDGTNPKVLFDYLVLLKHGGQSLCPGAPKIDHVAADETNSGPVDLEATISDDQGLAYPPQLLYATSDPGMAPKLSDMSQVTMQQVSGDMQSGVWRATVPNPVAGQAPGSSAELFYVILAGDGTTSTTCSGQTLAPSTGSYSMTITADSGGACSAQTAFACGEDNKYCDTSGAGSTCEPCPTGSTNCNGIYTCECDGVCVAGKCQKACNTLSVDDCGNETKYCDTTGSAPTCKTCPAGKFNCNGISGCECSGVGCDGNACLKPCSGSVKDDCGTSLKYCDTTGAQDVCRSCESGKYNCNGLYGCECSSGCSGDSCG